MIQNHKELTARTFVDVHAIQEELDQVRWGLHADGAGSEAAQHAAAEARASVCNLIAVVGNEPELGAISSVLDRLSITNPSRTLILLAQHTREADKLEAEVSAQERTESGHRVTTERVVLHAHGEPARHLASLAAPLLIPDLPVVLWWPGRPEFDSPLFNDLCELADRLIVDTDEGFDETDLTRLLEVARRTTARASLDRLRNEGLISRQSGRGSIVLQPKVEQPVNQLASFSEDMRTRGLRASYATFSAAEADVPDEAAEALNVPHTTKVFSIRRLLLADDEPIGMSQSWLAPWVLAGGRTPTPEELDAGSLYVWLADFCGARIAGAKEFIEAAIADAAMARRLDLAPGSPLLVARRRSYAENRNPIEYAVMHYRADRYRFSIDLTRR